MVGDICCAAGLSGNVVSLKKEEVQDQITEDDVMCLDDGRKATQVVFMKGRVAEEVGRWMRGRTHITVFAAGVAVVGGGQ